MYPDTAIPNSERIHVVSADRVSSTELNFNENSRVSASENFEFGIADPDMCQTPRKAISKLVQKCLNAKGVGCEAWEKEIDVRVAKLYGLEDNYDLN
jgi:hypothetical protein